MKPAGTGRILLWNGGSLWIGRSGEPTDFHEHHAVQISLPLSAGSLRFCFPGEGWESHQAIVIAANQAHAFEARGEYVAMIFVEPESSEGQMLQQRCRETGSSPADLNELQNEMTALRDSFQQNMPDADLAVIAGAIISRLAASNLVVKTLDRRIKRAIESMRGRVGGSIMLADMAEIACLSPDRFRHLFIEETGMRFRPYVLWLRIEIALAEFAAHKSLTDASHAGGFADSAHFSRTFKRMFGIAPSSLQLN